MLLQDRVARPQAEGQVAEQINRLFKAGTQVWKRERGTAGWREGGRESASPREQARPGQATGHSSYRVTWTAS